LQSSKLKEIDSVRVHLSDLSRVTTCSVSINTPTPN